MFCFSGIIAGEAYDCYGRVDSEQIYELLEQVKHGEKAYGVKEVILSTNWLLRVQV